MAEFREVVREAVSIEALVRESTALNAAGRILKGICPFHAEHTPSLVVWPDEGRWQCFGACNQGGDAFAWVMKRDGVDFRAALVSLAKRAGIPVPNQAESAEQKAARELQDRADGLLRVVVDYYRACLAHNNAGAAVRDYLKSRGLGNKEFWEKKLLGAAGNANGLMRYLKEMGADIDLAVRIGVIGEKDGRRYDFFRNRVIIPVLDGGRIAYLTSRAIDDGQPKYLHLPTSEFFSKIPYGWRSGAKGRIVVEGPFDAWSVEQFSSDVAPIALQGLQLSDPLLAKALGRAERVWAGLDMDAAGRKNIDQLAWIAGPQKLSVAEWPEPHKDACEWWTAGGTPEKFGEWLAGATSWLDWKAQEVRAATDKAAAVQRAVEIAARLDAAYADQFLAEVKKAARSAVKASTVDALFRAAKKVAEPADIEPEQGEAEPHFRIAGDEVWAGKGEGAWKVLSGGYAKYVEMITIDDGIEPRVELAIDVYTRANRQHRIVRLSSAASGEPGDVIKAIKTVAGPLITVGARARNSVIPAIEEISVGQIAIHTEFKRTGWVEVDGRLVFCTPGGTVGELPEGNSCTLPEDYAEHYAINDGTDEEFRQGVEGLQSWLDSMPVEITYPALAFALLPPAVRFMGVAREKFAMLFRGETGSLKTASALLLSGLYGPKAVDGKAVTSFRSTINRIEKAGFWMPEVMVVVDDYKRSLVKPWDIIGLIQRYAEENGRMRLNARAEEVAAQPFRGWMLLTGENLPQGESSVLARTVTLNFKRRGDGEAWNPELLRAQRLSKFFPVVMYRWIEWLRDNHAEQGLASRLLLNKQQYAEEIQASVQTPNVGRISTNLAILETVWWLWMEFLLEKTATLELPLPVGARFRDVGVKLAVGIAKDVSEDSVTKQFLRAVQELLDGEQYVLARRIGSEGIPPLKKLLGWWDEQGVYLLTGAYDMVAKERPIRETFTASDLAKALKDEGLLAGWTGEGPSRVIYLNDPSLKQSRRAWHLRPGLIEHGSGM